MKAQEMVMVCGTKISFSGGKNIKGQIYIVAASCLLHLDEFQDVLVPKNQRVLALSAQGWDLSVSVLSISASQSPENKGIKTSK